MFEIENTTVTYVSDTDNTPVTASMIVSMNGATDFKYDVFMKWDGCVNYHPLESTSGDHACDAQDMVKFWKKIIEIGQDIFNNEYWNEDEQ